MNISNRDKQKIQGAEAPQHKMDISYNSVLGGPTTATPLFKSLAAADATAGAKLNNKKQVYGWRSRAKNRIIKSKNITLNPAIALPRLSYSSAFVTHSSGNLAKIKNYLKILNYKETKNSALIIKKGAGSAKRLAATDVNALHNNQSNKSTHPVPPTGGGMRNHLTGGHASLATAKQKEGLILQKMNPIIGSQAKKENHPQRPEVSGHWFRWSKVHSRPTQLTNLFSDWQSVFADLNNLIGKKRVSDSVNQSTSASSSLTRGWQQPAYDKAPQAVVSGALWSIGGAALALKGKRDRGIRRIDISHIESLPEKDNATKLFKQIAKSINEKSKIKEQRNSQFKKQLELRKYLKSLYTFKPDLAYNQNIVYKYAQTFDQSEAGSWTNVASAVTGYRPAPQFPLRRNATAAGAPLALAVRNPSHFPPLPVPLEGLIGGRVQGEKGGKNILRLGVAMPQNLYNILKNSFLTFYCVISKPIIEITPNKVKIKLFYYNTNRRLRSSLAPAASAVGIPFSYPSNPPNPPSLMSEGKGDKGRVQGESKIQRTLPLSLALLNKSTGGYVKPMLGLPSISKLSLYAASAMGAPAQWLNSDHFKYKNYVRLHAEQKKELEVLCINLSKIMNTSVVMDLVELQAYHLEGNILANSIGLITDKLGRNFRRTVNKIFKKSMIINPRRSHKMALAASRAYAGGIGYAAPYLRHAVNKAIAFFTGINIRLAGRLSRQSIIPRKTVKTIQKGSLARRHTDFLTISKYTAKNRRGIFCYTITIGHKYY